MIFIFAKLHFKISKNMLEVAEQKFLLGELTCDILCITPDEFNELYDNSSKIKNILNSVYENGNTEILDKTNLYIENIREILLNRTLFKIVNDAIQEELSKTEVLTINDIKECIKTEQEMAQVKMLIKIEKIKNQIILAEQYCQIVDDIYAFNQTIFNFIDYYLSRLIKLDSENYAAALYDFLNNPSRHKLIVNYFYTDTAFSLFDQADIRFEPTENNGEFSISEVYSVEKLQSFLRIDFMKSLMVCHIIRRCKNCKQFFLLTKGYRTEYCDRPLPNNPRRNCRNQGAKNSAKEKAENDPKIRSYDRAYQRIYADARRGNITDEEFEITKEKIKDLRDEAFVNNWRDEKLEKYLSSEILYKSLGIQREKQKV